MTNTVTIPLDAALAIATANGWTYNEATETEWATVQNADGAIYIADPNERQAESDMARVLGTILRNAVNTVPYTTVAVEVTA